jgi:formate hydrogenlyase subunit 3/multisubunit Na+/H+ antiporter MnhD subunit
MFMFQHLNFSATTFAIAILFWSIQVLTSLLYVKKCRHDISAFVFLVPSALLLLSAISAWLQPSIHFASNSILMIGTEVLSMKLDLLSSLFLFLLAAIGSCTSIFSLSYLPHLKDHLHPGHYWSALSLFMLSMSMLLVSANALSFLVFWELMALSSFALIASEHQKHKVRDAAVVYLTATRIATACLTAGFVLMFSVVHSWDFSAWSFSRTNLLPALLIAVGLCIKSGLWPFHLWLPYAYTAAPSPVSAIMSGVMTKLSLYAAIRILVNGGVDSLIIIGLFLVLGLISAFWGLLFALVQQDLKKLLAYSSIENLGIIFCGLGLALLARRLNIPDAACLALTACIFQTFNHGFFKPLLFLCAGTIDVAANTRDLSQLGGLARRLPFTMICFLLGSIALCALPPLNGFASKWLLYTALFHQAWESPQIFVRALCLVWIGTLGLVGGLAIFCFTRAIGITFLGNARSSAAGNADELGKSSRIAQAILASACVLIGLASPFVAQHIQTIACVSLKIPVPHASPFQLPLATVTLFSVLAIAFLYAFFLNASKIRMFNTWDCGFGALSARTQIGSLSFTQPIARIFSPILRYKLLIEINGKDRRHFPESIQTEAQTISVLETKVYLPILAFIRRAAGLFAKIQAGSIHLYLLYLCITLALLIIVGAYL